MRQVRKDISGSEVRGGFPKEGISEGISRKCKRFDEEKLAFIKKRRAELILEGNNDWNVGQILGREMGRTPVSISQKIGRLVALNEIPENPNRKERFSEEELDRIRKRRAELILRGKNDGQIAEVLAAEMGRHLNSVKDRIYDSVKNGKLLENPNRRNNFSKEEIALLNERRDGLILEGENDGRISRILDAEMGRPFGSLARKIHELVAKGRMAKNPNKQTGFSEEEVALIKSRRAELIPKGKKDSQISLVLAGEMERSAKGISAKLSSLCRRGELPGNPNRGDNFFEEEEVSYLDKRRKELIQEGRTDHAIAGILALETDRDSVSIRNKICNLIRKGELSENPNKRGRVVSEDELASELSAAADMYLGDSP